MIKFFLHLLLMFGMPMFAAGSSAVADAAGGGDGAGTGATTDDSGHDQGTGAGDEGLGDGGEDGSRSSTESADDSLGEPGDRSDADQHREDPDKDTADFKGLVSRRLLALKKEAPELTAVFQKYPKVQEQVEAAFRRDMAYRELYPTIAEARAMREHFPNGVADVEQLLGDVQQAEEVDRGFYVRNANGEYPGHAELLRNWMDDDPQAMSAMFRTAIQLMPRLDPDTYREVGGSIVAATLAASEIPEWITELRDAAKNAKQDQLAASLDKMLRWASGFSKRRTEPTEEERRIAGQRDQLRRETSERQNQDQQRFRQTLNTDSHKLQQSIVRKHPAVAQMLTTKGISDVKKAEIVGKIQGLIQNHLKNSRAFITKYKAALVKGDARECIDIQKVAWSYPWILNKYVRQVLAAETPNLVAQNRARAGTQRTTTQARTQTRANGAQQKEHTEPYKEDGVWKSKDGRRLTTAEILRGAVPAHLLNA